jgi:phospholipase A1/A2
MLTPGDLRNRVLRSFLFFALSLSAEIALGSDLQNALHTCQTEFSDDASRRLVCFDQVVQ